MGYAGHNLNFFLVQMSDSFRYAQLVNPTYIATLEAELLSSAFQSKTWEREYFHSIHNSPLTCLQLA